MATVTNASTTLDPGTAGYVKLTNTGGVQATIRRGDDRTLLWPGSTLVVIPAGVPVTAVTTDVGTTTAVTVSTGSVDTSLPGAGIVEWSDLSDAAKAVMTGTFVQVFKPSAYGAAADGVLSAAASIASGSATLTLGTAKFVPAHAGKSIIVDGAGAAGESLITTIQSYTSGTQVTLAATAGTTVSNGCAAWGTDDTAAWTAMWAAWYSAGGGEIEVPRGVTIHLGQMVVPNNGNAGFPKQPAGRVVGRAGQADGHLIHETSWVDGGGSVIVLTSATGPAKIDTRGAGRLEITSCTIVSLANASNPICQTTNTTLSAHHNRIVGPPSKNRLNAVQDAFVLGGTNNAIDVTANGGFQGYGTHIHDNHLDNIRRGMWGRTYCNGVIFGRNVFAQTCGGESPIFVDGTGFEARSNFFPENIIEVSNYTYGARFLNSSDNIFALTSWYDYNATNNTALLRLEGASSGTWVNGGRISLPTNKFISDAGSNAYRISGSNGEYGTVRLGGGSGKVLVQPFQATGLETANLLNVRRSDVEATNPNVDVMSVQQNGTVNVSGASAQVIGPSGSGHGFLALSSASFGLFRHSGDAGTVELDPRAGGSVKITSGVLRLPVYTTATRPAANGFAAGFMVYDSTLNLPIFSDGSAWKKFDGTTA